MDERESLCLKIFCEGIAYLGYLLELKIISLKDYNLTETLLIFAKYEVPRHNTRD